MRSVPFSFLKSGWFWLIAAAYLLRILLMPLTGQHDVMFMPWMAHFVSLGHFNLYAYLVQQFGEASVMNQPAIWAPYPFGYYAYTAGWLWVMKAVGAINLVDWNSIWGVAHPARVVFLVKLSYLPFDLLIGYVLYRQ